MRRSFVWPLLAIACLCAEAQAQAFPARTVRIVVAFPAGGGTEIAARAAPDGHTLCMGTMGNLSVNKHLFP